MKLLVENAVPETVTLQARESLIRPLNQSKSANKTRIASIFFVGAFSFEKFGSMWRFFPYRNWKLFASGYGTKENRIKGRLCRCVTNLAMFPDNVDGRFRSFVSKSKETLFVVSAGYISF